jgi:hypothetical protein
VKLITYLSYPMFLEEKIDRIKMHFPQADFRVPFTEGSGILKKIEARFVINAKPAYERTNWTEGLKERVLLRAIDRKEIGKALLLLDTGINYWVVVVVGDGSMAQPFVFDCKPTAMEQLIAIAPGDFYIGDKKYAWLVYFAVDRAENAVALIKAGNFPTPFDLLST